jgi:predicted nucleotidyltransferase component of viral defense system
MDASSVLTPLQRRFLSAFFAHEVGKRFFLTGGTALAAFYLHHRLSRDVDLFTTDDDALPLARREIPLIASSLGCQAQSGTTTSTFQVFLLESRNEPALKVDLVRDVDVQFGTRQEIEGIVVDAVENIAVNKVLSVFGRTESKDFVDLYFLLQAGHDFRHLVALARQKDTGLSEFWLAGMLREVTRLKDLPQMLKPLTLEELQSFFLELADREFAAVRPPDWD